METQAELKALRHGLARGTPFGDTHWQTRTAECSATNRRFSREAGQVALICVALSCSNYKPVGEEYHLCGISISWIVSAVSR